MSPFEFINAISHTKEQLIVDETTEREYNSFMVNRGLSQYIDTAMYANEMNMMPDLPNAAKFAYLINSIRPRKRYGKWAKGRRDEYVEAVAERYGFGTDKAREAVAVLSDEQLEEIKRFVNDGRDR